MRNFLIAVFVCWLIIVVLIIRDDKERAGMVDPKSKQTNRVEVVFWQAMGGPLGKVMKDLVDRYNNSQDKYYIKSVNMGGYDTLAKKLLASLVANEAPDIAQCYETLTKKFIKNKKIVCLDDMIASETEDIKSDIIPVLLRNNTYDGKLYSFPFNKSVPVLYYNKDMFKEVGLDPEHPPETWSELASYARIVTNYYKKTKPGAGIYGYGCSKASAWNYLNKVIEFGGSIVTEDGRKAEFDKPPAIEALRFMQNIIKEGIAKEGQRFDHQNDFKARKVAIIESSIISKLFMESGIDFNFGVAPLPKEKKRGVILAGTNVNIFDNGDPEKIKGAWDFIKWFTSTDIGAEWSIRTTYSPVRKSSLKSKIFLDALKKDPNLRAPYAQLDYCYFEPRLTCWFEIRDLIADYLERATIEMGPPEKYCEGMNNDANAILRHASE